MADLLLENAVCPKLDKTSQVLDKRHLKKKQY